VLGRFFARPNVRQGQQTASFLPISRPIGIIFSILVLTIDLVEQISLGHSPAAGGAKREIKVHV
jgi:hypothetical protein